MSPAIRVSLFVLGVLFYLATGLGLVQHAAERKLDTPPTQQKRVDPEADPLLKSSDDVERIVVESSGRVVVSPDHVTRPAQ